LSALLIVATSSCDNSFIIVLPPID